MRSMLLLLFFVPALLSAQQRYLITSRQEVYPISKAQSAARLIEKQSRKSLSKVSAACGNKFTFGFTEEKYPPSVNHIAFHKDIMGEWFVAKATGTIDSVFWDSGNLNSAKDSILLVRIHNSVIGPTYGPGVRPGPFDPPCQNWGYWVDLTDADQGVAAFPEDANPPGGPWHSTIAHGTSGPPFANEIWGLGGYPATDHVNVINHVAMLDNGIPCSVVLGQNFFINMRVNSINAHVDDNATGGVIWATWNTQVSKSDENYPSRNWKFYEHDSGPANCGIDKNLTKRGWVARGGFNGNDSLNVAALNWWYTMTVSSNTPPEVTDTDIPHNTLSTGPQTVGADIVDCNPANPGDAGVTSAKIFWSVNDVVQTPIDMAPVIGDAWQGTIPGQPAGTTINYFIRALDNENAQGNGQSITYRIVDLTNDYYVIDTFSVCSHANISGTGTDIDTSKFFNDVGGTNPKDDGTAGPFAIPGGPMTIFGDTARYVWVGTNGAIALSKTATDTLDVTSSGAYSGTWSFPMRQRDGRADTNNRTLPPGNFIAPFYADFIIGDTTAQYGHIVYGDGGDPCQFIVEWDSLGTFDASGAIADNSTFRVVLNRCDGTIRYEFDIVGTHGQDSAALVGMQADSNNVTAGYGPTPPATAIFPGYLFLNRNAFPLETKPTPGRCIVFTPGAAYYAKSGWNLLSVSTTPLAYDKTKAYPGATSQAFKYSGSYQTAATLANGIGYWLKYDKPIYAGVAGHHFASIVDTVGNRWNMIGTPSKPVTPGSVVAGGTAVVSNYFGYAGGTYQIIGSLSFPTLNPGNGYWVKTNTVGTLTLNGSTNLPKEVNPVADELAAMSTLTIRDAAGRSQTLYLGSDASVKNLDMYEMPPSMADLSGFDVRFASGRIAETYAAVPAAGQSFEYPVKVTSNAYPITITWARAKGEATGMKLAVRDEKGKLFGVIDGSNGMVRVTNAAVKTLVINLGGNFNVPKVFALSQNYPNPFNPNTHFSVDVPRTANVEIAVYDILGQKVSTLLTGEQPAGRMTVNWDGRDGNGMTVPSGAYFVRMKSDEFTSVRKIMLMK